MICFVRGIASCSSRSNMYELEEARSAADALSTIHQIFRRFVL